MTDDPFAPSEGPLDEPRLPEPVAHDLPTLADEIKPKKSDKSKSMASSILAPEAGAGSYIVLQEDLIEAGNWLEVGLFTGATADAAIRAAAAAIFESGTIEARLVACPARSWKPRTANVRPVPAITLS